MARTRGRPPHDDRLTPAEWRTVDAVRHGLSNKEIARRRGISVDGVKYHVANAISKLGLEKRADLRHYPGAPRTGALATKEVIVNETADITGLGQVARNVRNIEETEAWYRDVLELEHLFTFGKMAFFDCGGTRLMLTESDDAGTPESILYFRVADIDAAYRRLLDRDAVSVSAPHMIHRHEDGTEEWMAFFEDPEGRPIGIMARVTP